MSEYWMVTCRACRGRGTQAEWTDERGHMHAVEMACDACNGRGEIAQQAEHSNLAKIGSQAGNE